MSAPDGFHLADRLQVADFAASGSISGAAKVTHDGVDLCTRLRPPADRSDSYIAAYRAGWLLAKTGHDITPNASRALWAGFLDRSAGRMKWHSSYCLLHHNGVGGCGVA